MAIRWDISTNSKTQATLAGATELRVVDDPAGAINSKKTTLTALAAFVKSALGLTSTDISDFNEAAQDAVGGALLDTTTIDLTYNDALAQFSADVRSDSITDTLLRNSVGLSVIGRAANSTGDPADIVASSDNLVMRRSGTSIGFGQIVDAGITDNTISINKLADFAAVTVLGRSANSTGAPAGITAGSNDRILARTSNALSFTQLTNGMVPDNTLTIGKIAATTSQRLFGRASASAGLGEEITLSSVLDWLGATNGFVAYRTGGAWTANTPDNAGLVDKASSQTISGVKTFSGGLVVTAQNPEFIAGDVNNSVQIGSTHDGVGELVGELLFPANNSAAARKQYGKIRYLIVDPTAGSEDSQVTFRTLVAGTETDQINATAGVFLASATGGAQGTGTLNATALYDDGVVIVCMPHNADMTQEEWDALTVHGREVEVEREQVRVVREDSWFSKSVKWATLGRVEIAQVRETTVKVTQKERIDEPGAGVNITAKRHFRMKAEGFDASDPENYFSRLDADKALPGLITQDEWKARMIDGGVIDKVSLSEINERTILAMDYLALATRAVHEKNKELETRLAALESGK